MHTYRADRNVEAGVCYTPLTNARPEAISFGTSTTVVAELLHLLARIFISIPDNYL